MTLEVGNVVIFDGKVGVVSQIYSNFNGDWNLVPKCFHGVYLNGVDFSIKPEDNYIILDECLNNYINRHVRRFGKLKVENKDAKHV